MIAATKKEMITGLSAQGAEEVLILDYLSDFAFEVVILDENGKLDLERAAKYIYTKKIPFKLAYGTYAVSFQQHCGEGSVCFTVVDTKDKFDKYLELSNKDNTTLQDSIKLAEELKMGINKRKQKSRKSTKVIVTYTNDKSFTLKNVKDKVKINKDFVEVKYFQKDELGGVTLSADNVVASIPLQDLTSIKILPDNSLYGDSVIKVEEGVVKSHEIYNIKNGNLLNSYVEV